MRCIICDKDLVVKYKYGLKIYEHDDGTVCKHLNNSKIKVNNINFKFNDDDRALHALIDTRSGIEEIVNRFKSLDNKRIIMLLNKFYKDIIKNIDMIMKISDVDIKILEYLKVYLKEFRLNNECSILYIESLCRSGYNENIDTATIEEFREECKKFRDNMTPLNVVDIGEFISRDEINDKINNVSKNIKYKYKLKDKILELRKDGGVK